MPAVDEDVLAALGEEEQRPAWFAFIDLEDDPIRVTTAGYEVTFAGTGDSDLDSETFAAIDHRVVEVGEVTHREGGSETLTCTLSGIVEFDEDTLDGFGDRTKWQGRLFRLWMMLRDEDGAPVGLIVPYYTGYMAALEILPSPEAQVMKVSVENYLAAMTAQPSNRTYLNQKLYDAADESASATLAAINGAKAGPGAAIYGTPGGPGPGRDGGGNFWNPTVNSMV